MNTTDKEQRIAAIKDAVQRGGGIVKFAKAMGISHQAVYHWYRRGWVPLHRAVTMEALFGVPSTAVMDPAVLRALDLRDAATTLI
jgi:transposase-like protein